MEMEEAGRPAEDPEHPSVAVTKGHSASDKA